MIRFKLALAGMLIAPALAPAQEPKSAGPASPFGSGPLSQPARTTYLDEDLVPYSFYSRARPGSAFDVYPLMKPRKPAQVDPLQANFGLQLASADDALRAQLDIPSGQGVVIVAVKPGGLAEQGGLKPNDVLLKLGDKEVDGIESATKALLGLGKEALEVKLIREGKPSRMSLVGPEHGFPPEAAEFWIGVPVSPVDATLRSHLPTLGAEGGLIANDVVKGSPADSAGLLKNDILVAMGGQPLKNPDSLIEQIQATKGKSASVEILRGGKSITINVVPARRAHPTTINLPGNRPKNFAYWVTAPQVAVEMKPGRPTDGPAKQESAQPGLIRLWDGVSPSLNRWNVETFRIQPDLKYDAIVVNPHGVEGSRLAGVPETPYDIHLRMAPRMEMPDATSNARIEARLNEISAKLEDLRKAVDGLKKAEGR